jgi:hypothetical protein
MKLLIEHFCMFPKESTKEVTVVPESPPGGLIRGLDSLMSPDEQGKS